MTEERVTERDRMMDELLLLLPVLSRSLGRPWPRRVREIEGDIREVDAVAGCKVPIDVPEGISPGQVQVLISLSRGPRSVGSLAEEVGVSSPAVTQLVDRLVEHGMVERRPDPLDRRVVLVDFVPEMREAAREITAGYKSHLEGVVEDLDDEEMRGFVKGLRLLSEGLGGTETPLARPRLAGTARGGEGLGA